MARRIKARLDTRDLEKAIKELTSYKSRLTDKCRELVSRLADEGIRIGLANRGDFGARITFLKKLDPVRNGCRAVVLGTSSPLRVQWYSYGKVKEADIMPILMAEFGSGPKASDASGQPNADKARELGMGQGTFPGQTHAFDDSWSWQDLEGVWHTSSGTEPSMPMFKAAMEMRMRVNEIARAVFST